MSKLGELALLLLKGIAWIYFILPRSIQRFLGLALGEIVFWTGAREAVVCANLARAFPKEFAKQKSLVRKFYHHLGQLIFETLMILGPMGRFIRKYVDCKGVHNLDAALAKGKGVIFLASHVGNWEIMCGTAPVLIKRPFLLITKHLKPEWLHRGVERARLNYGVSATYEPRTLLDTLRELRKNGIVGFSLDQYTGPPVMVRVPVFGTPVGTHIALASIARRTGAAVVPAFNFRLPNGRFHVEICPEIPWISHPNPHQEIALNTAQYSAHLEQFILTHPDQWLWSHQRFKGDLSPLNPNEWAGNA